MPYERRRKKRAAPQPSPHATPSPKPKDMRLAEKDQRKSNATTPTQPPTNTQQPPTATQQPLTVTQQPPATTQQPPAVTQQPTTKRSVTRATSDFVVKNQNTMREYTLQRVVQAAQRGTFIVDDKYNLHKQYRHTGNQFTLAVQGHGQCKVQLVRWKEGQQQFTCSLQRAFTATGGRLVPQLVSPAP